MSADVHSLPMFWVPSQGRHGARSWGHCGDCDGSFLMEPTGWQRWSLSMSQCGVTPQRKMSRVLGESKAGTQ